MNKRNGGGMIMELSYYASDCKIKNVAFRTRPRLFAVKLQRQNWVTNDSQGSKRYDIIFNDGADFFNSMNYEKIEVSIREKLLLNQKMIGTEQGDL